MVGSESLAPLIEAAVQLAVPARGLRDEFMAYPTLIPQSEQQEDLHLLPQTNMDESLWRSLKDNIRAALFPEKLPPLC